MATIESNAVKKEDVSRETSEEKPVEIELKEEQTKLELENTDQSGSKRIEEFAKNKLNMMEANPDNIIQLENK